MIRHSLFSPASFSRLRLSLVLWFGAWILTVLPVCASWAAAGKVPVPAPRTASAAAQIVVPPPSSGQLGLELTVATTTATFRFTLPEAGCVAIAAQNKGKRGNERLWGPFWREAGSYVATLPTSLVTARKGILEVYSLSLHPVSVIGRSGKGERQFIRPMGLGWDPTARELYVADTGNDRIVRLSADGRFVAQYGGFGVAFGDDSEEREDSLDEPWDVAPGGFSNFYVTDQNNDRVCEFDAYKNYRGTTYPKPGDRGARLNRPRGAMVDGENNLWIVDGRGDRVLKLNSYGSKLFELGGFGWSSQKVKDPTQVAVDESGRIYICDRGNRRIGVFDRLGSYLNDITKNLKAPSGVAVDPDGIVFVCDEQTNEVSAFLPDGRLLGSVGGMSERDRFRYPADLVALADQIYVLDSGNHRIVVLERRKERKETYWQADSPMIQ
ncbi:MAG TPA: NHL repeat-containing protein [Candidatus Ozemobacteraceae bacterium]|nr:NHL repeat-containing protein [Candidatus Ozemobacteraceae bacterium]